MTLCTVSRSERSILDSGEDTGQALNSNSAVEETVQQTVDSSLSALESILRTSTETVGRILATDPQVPTGQVLGNAIANHLSRRRENIANLRERSVIVFTSTPDISQSESRGESEARSGESLFGARDFQFSPVVDSAAPQVLLPRPLERVVSVIEICGWILRVVRVAQPERARFGGRAH